MTPRPSRPPASIYVAGLFAMGYTEFYTFLIPLYGLSLGMSAGEIGMLVGGRSLLAVFLSIHVGVLMDRSRHPPGDPVLRLDGDGAGAGLSRWSRGSGHCCCCRCVNGGALSFAWSGSQTLIAQLAEGEAEYIGRFSFFARIGTTLSADRSPASPGICGGAWPSYMIGRRLGHGADDGAVARARRRRSPTPTARGQRRPAGFRARDAIPRLPDYVALLRADGDPGGGDDDGDHVSAHRDQRRAELALHRLSQRDRAHRHVDRHPVRGDRGRRAVSARCSPGGRCGSATRSARC